MLDLAGQGQKNTFCDIALELINVIGVSRRNIELQAVLLPPIAVQQRVAEVALGVLLRPCVGKEFETESLYFCTCSGGCPGSQ